MREPNWSRVGPWWRVLPDVLAHKLADRGLLPTRLQALACRWRGPHKFRYEVAGR